MKMLIMGLVASTAVLLPVTVAFADDGDAHKVTMSQVYKRPPPPAVKYLSNAPHGKRIVHHRQFRAEPQPQY